MKTIVVFLFFAIAQSLLPVSYLESTSHTTNARHSHALQQSTISHASAIAIDETTVEEEVSGYTIEPVEILLAIAQIPLQKASTFVINTKLEFTSSLLRYIALLITSPPLH